MYEYEYIRYLNLPQLPQSVLDLINMNLDEYEKKVVRLETYTWSDSFNEEVNRWCQENICKTMYWGFQIIESDVVVHKDVGPLTKLNYILIPGGDNVVTEFYAEDKTTLVNSVTIEPRRWHLLKADSYHAVRNIEPGKKRFSITGKVF